MFASVLNGSYFQSFGAEGVPIPESVSSGDFNLTGIVNQAVNIGFSIVEAAIILLVGWTLSKIVRSILVRALGKTKIDNQLAALLTGGRSEKLAVEETLGALVYGFMMLFVSIEVLQALGLTMVTEPLNNLLSQMMGFVPQLFAAGALALVAWCAASLARVFTKNVLQNLNLDRRVGEAMDDREEEGPSLVQTLGDASYYFVFLFFLPQMLDALRMQGLSPVREMVGEILAVIPDLLGAGIMLTMFYFVAKIVQRLVTQVLAGAGFDQLPGRLGFGEGAGPKASAIAGWVVLISIISMGAVQAAENLGLALISEAVQGLMSGMVQVFLASGILVVGLYVGNLAQNKVIHREKSRGREGTSLASLARVGILGVAWVMALGQSGLAPEIIHLAFGAFVLGMAIAVGLAFGLGGRESAARWLESRRTGAVDPG